MQQTRARWNRALCLLTDRLRLMGAADGKRNCAREGEPDRRLENKPEETKEEAE